MTIVRIANTLKLTTTVSLQRSQVSKKMSTNCIFCKIISGEVQGDIVYQDQEIIIFKDIKPASTYHYLACPKEHIGNINSLKRSDIPLVENLMERGKQVLQSNGADLNHVLMGFHKPPFNTISHLHLHLISPSLQMSYLHKIMFKPGTWWFVDMSTNCIFCKIISGEVQDDIVYQDQEIIIFKDIKPLSTYHYLACPKEHVENVNSLKRSDIPLVENLMERGKQVLQSNGADINDLLMGFHKPPFNSISHLHLHLIAPSLQMSFLHKITFKPGTWWFVEADTMIENLNLKL